MAVGGSVTISNPNEDTLVVSITSTTGQTWYTNAGLSSAASFPDTITDTTTYYTGVNGRSTVSVERNGVEIANTPDGTRLVELREGQKLTFEPSSDPEKRLAPAELTALYHPLITPAAHITVASASGDEDVEARDAIDDIVAALVDAGILEAPAEA